MFKEVHLQIVRIQVQNTQDNDMFLLYVLESQNTKDETLTPHHYNKLSKH